jgi:uncharacterized protein (DUF1810 family)
MNHYFISSLDEADLSDFSFEVVGERIKNAAGGIEMILLVLSM